jgi:hypothetical protein
MTAEFRKTGFEVPEEHRTALSQGNWADAGEEGCFVPHKRGHSKNGPEYRYLATRQELKQAALPGMERGDEDHPFPVMKLKGRRYKIFGIVTNRDWTGQELIPWR